MEPAFPSVSCLACAFCALSPRNLEPVPIDPRHLAPRTHIFDLHGRPPTPQSDSGMGATHLVGTKREPIVSNGGKLPHHRTCQSEELVTTHSTRTSPFLATHHSFACAGVGAGEMSASIDSGRSMLRCVVPRGNVLRRKRYVRNKHRPLRG